MSVTVNIGLTGEAAVASSGTPTPTPTPNPGSDGAPGSVWRMGITDPVNSMGINGDAYLNTSSGNVFTKVNGAYSVQGNIRGPQGIAVNGAPGQGFRPPVSVNYASALTLDCAVAETFNIGALTGDLQLGFTGGVDGQKIIVNVPQGPAGGKLITFNASVAFSDDIPSVTLSTAPNKVDVLGFIYRASVGKYRLVSYTKGF